MFLKIDFTSFVPLNKGDTYIFVSVGTIYNQLYMEYHGTSRIDGLHIFSLDKSKSGNLVPVTLHTLNGVSIDSACIVSVNDHIPFIKNDLTEEIGDFFYTETGHEPYDVRILSHLDGDIAYVTVKIDINKFVRHKKINMLLD